MRLVCCSGWNSQYRPLLSRATVNPTIPISGRRGGCRQGDSSTRAFGSVFAKIWSEALNRSLGEGEPPLTFLLRFDASAYLESCAGADSHFELNPLRLVYSLDVCKSFT